MHNSKKSGTFLINQEWHVINFTEDTLITSDHPIVCGKYNNDLDFRDTVLLAISPRHLFVISNYINIINEIERKKEHFAKKYNKIVCMKSAKYTYCTQLFSQSEKNKNFIRKNFRTIKPENLGIFDDASDIIINPNKDLFLPIMRKD